MSLEVVCTSHAALLCARLACRLRQCHVHAWALAFMGLFNLCYIFTWTTSLSIETFDLPAFIISSTVGPCLQELLLRVLPSYPTRNPLLQSNSQQQQKQDSADSLPLGGFSAEAIARWLVPNKAVATAFLYNARNVQ